MSDQYIPPFVIVDESGNPVGPILDGDAVVTFNFRADRMVMIAKALEYEDFDKFDRVRFPKIRYAGMLQYDGELKLPSHYLVSPPEIERTSGEYLVYNGIRTFACRYVTILMNPNVYTEWGIVLLCLKVAPKEPEPLDLVKSELFPFYVKGLALVSVKEVGGPYIQ